MRLRFLFTLGLVLLLSTLASSNECRHRFCGKVCGTTSEATGTPSATAVPSIRVEYSTLLVNKLLYL